MKASIITFLLLCALLGLCVLSAPAAERRELDTQAPASAAGQPMLSQLPTTNRLRLAISLPLHNYAALTNLLKELYDRRSTNFRRFLTPDQFTERFGPTEQDYQRVKDFAVSNHLEVVETFGNRAVLDVSGAVADIEDAFRVKLGYYQHPTEHRQYLAPDRPPTVEADLPIRYVSGLDTYVQPHSTLRQAERGRPADQTNTLGNGIMLAGGSGENGYYLGADFRNAYVPGVTNTGGGEVVGLVEFDGYTPSDITVYEQLAGLPNVTLTNVLIAPVTNNEAGTGNSEVALDIEMVIAMAPGLSKVVVVEGNEFTSVPDIMNAFVSPGDTNLFANQISSSWSPTEATNLDTQLMEMAAQGQTFFQCSFDGGAPAGGTNFGAANWNYLTEVGGTYLSMTNNGNMTNWSAEVVWDYQPSGNSGGASTGGYDPSVPIPDYQKGVNMTAVGGSALYRNIPDVAMVAFYIEDVYSVVYTNGTIYDNLSNYVSYAGGTSAAAPLWAGFTALVNQQAKAMGRPPVGFLNPAIYEIGLGANYHNCFHDITVGNNTNADSNNLFFAAPGYDLCTGWGTPNGANLINALVGYAGPDFVDFNYTGGVQNGAFDTPFVTLAQGVSAVSNNGTIFIETAGSSSETINIHKPMKITAMNGTATIGN